jgi:three-Cys-motif partner protein
VALTDHEFGGVSTNPKLSLVERYLSAFTTALQGKKELWYIDAFAGTGKRTVRLAARDSDLFDAAKKNKSSAIVALRESQLKQCHRSTG